MIAVLFTVFLIVASPAIAQIQDPEAEPAPEQKEVPLSETIDNYHSYLSSRIDEPVIWFDSFFGERRIEDTTLPANFIRFRFVTKYTEGENLTFPIRLHANLRLPNINERFRLIVTGQSEDELQEFETDDTIDTATRTDEVDDETTNVGLRYTIYKTLRTYLSLGGGMRVSWPLDYYIRARYQRLLHVAEKDLVRFSETFFWNSVRGSGATTRFDYERKITGSTSGRVSVFGTYEGENWGIEWGAETNLFMQLNEKSAVSLDFGAFGITQPSTIVETYLLGTRYRRNMFRPWFFFEIAPEVRWQLNEGGARHAISAISVVLEFQFRGK